ncbi:hypothetical protein P154DRAFT_538313 [Amniculicola lignicola CBS 123094]|uniref:Uncharacterized protein n=1 Tax=Amniculicola lignicola CBS 123094 TaxID=1392246 RepID=A0A6A5W7F0_9PLEO|nr:hypothetical protein P154DRAFT_538313 [Amniculicola lignicola CBS 123094]
MPSPLTPLSPGKATSQMPSYLGPLGPAKAADKMPFSLTPLTATKPSIEKIKPDPKVESEQTPMVKNPLFFALREPNTSAIDQEADLLKAFRKSTFDDPFTARMKRANPLKMDDGSDSEMEDLDICAPRALDSDSEKQVQGREEFPESATKPNPNMMQAIRALSGIAAKREAGADRKFLESRKKLERQAKANGVSVSQQERGQAYKKRRKDMAKRRKQRKRLTREARIQEIELAGSKNNIFR